MKYRLVVLTHGHPENGPLLEATIDSFLQRVTPGPATGIIYVDGGQGPARPGKWPWTIWNSAERVGFCGMCKRAWDLESTMRDEDYIFWLEHDFQFRYDVNLADLALVLSANRHLAQMALMRDAVNETEKAAGGLFESRPGEYRFNSTTIQQVYPPGEERWLRWLTHGSYFTTNPSLMRRRFMEDNPWPDHADQCEGKFGIELKAKGYRFGAWGAGEPWVTHTGVRTGIGY